MTMFDTGYKEQRNREARELYHRNRFCCECGSRSKTNLRYGHPVKYGNICSDCRDKLWFK